MSYTRMPKTALQQALSEIIARAAAAVAEAVREERSRLIATAPAPTLPAKVSPKRTRKSETKPAPVAAPAPVIAPAPPPVIAPAPAAPPVAKAGRKPHPRRSYTDADIDRMIDLIAATPRARGEDLRVRFGGDPRTVEKILEHLRDHALVRTEGVKRAMTYSVPRPATPAPSTKTPAAAPTETPAAAPPRPATPRPPSTTSNIVDLVRTDLHAAYEGIPVPPERIAFRIKQDRDLVDAALTYLVSRREARVSRMRGKAGYVPVRKQPV